MDQQRHLLGVAQRRCVLISSGKTNPQHQAGFTLVELMVVVALLGVLSALASPSFLGWLERTRVRSAAEAIHSGIQLARVEALSRNAPVRFTLQPSGAWSVACVSATTGAGCTDINVLHSRPAAEGRGAYTLQVNSADFVVDKTVDFLPAGIPNTMNVYIQQVDLLAAAGADSASMTRALRVNLSPFGRTRLCYPHGTAGTPTACS